MSKKQIAVIAAANAILASASGHGLATELKSGVIVAANESRFQSATFNQPLTQYAVGWKPEESLLELMEFLAPSVDVGRRFEFKRAINGEYFLSEQDDARAIGGSFKRIDTAGETIDARTYNKGLTIRVDKDEEQGADWQERKIDQLLRRLYMNELRRVIVALEAAANDTPIDWKIGDKNKDPDRSIRAALRRGLLKAGIQPNRLALGALAWQYRMDYYETIGSELAVARANDTPDRLAPRFAISSSRVIDTLYQENVVVSEKRELIGAKAYAFFADGGTGKDDPSNLKRFVSPTAQGGRHAVYVEEHPKHTDITVEHYSNVVVTSEFGLEKLTITQTGAA